MQIRDEETNLCDRRCPMFRGNYLTVFHGIPFLGMVNLLASATLLEEYDDDLCNEVWNRVFGGFLILFSVAPLSYFLSRNLLKTDHHLDCLC